MAEAMNLEAEPTNIRSLAPRILRYALAAIGPVGAAATQFILSLQLLHLLAPASFGSFSFLLVISQFSLGIWSALLCAPLPVVLAQEQIEGRRGLIDSLFIVNLVLSLLAFGAFWLLGIGLEVPFGAAGLFAGYAALALLRWFARAHAYATGAASRTVTSDLLYSTALLIGIGLVSILKVDAPDLPYGALLVSAAVSLLPFGRQYFLAQFVRLHPRELPCYAHVWREHARWSLVGVVTTEATVNAHAYIVTLVSGPLAFAPIAASALIIRPISVVMNALSEFERPQMARQIARKDIGAARHSAGIFLFVLALTWVLTIAAAVLLMAYGPGVVFPNEYSQSSLALGMTLWLAVTLMRVLRTPSSILLQAAGMFRSLAHASIISAIVSISAVVVLLILCGPLWSLGGILLGEAICAIWVWRQSWRWRSTFRVNPALSGNEVQP